MHKKALYVSPILLFLIACLGMLGPGEVQQAPDSVYRAIGSELLGLSKEEESKTIEYWNKACTEDEFVFACDWLAYRQTSGGGAIHLMAFAEPGCNRGAPVHCAMVAYALRQEGERLKDETLKSRATALMVQSCENGFGLSCDEIASMLKQNDSASLKKPEHYLQLGCEVNDATSCSHLGMLYQHGQGVEVDLEKALTYYKKGCALQPLHSYGTCARLGYLLAESASTLDEGFALLLSSCEGDISYGCLWAATNLQNRIAKEPAAYTNGDIEEVGRLYQRGCELNNGPSCVSGAKWLRMPPVQKKLLDITRLNGSGWNLSAAMAQLDRKGCALRQPYSCFNHGFNLYTLGLDSNTCQSALNVFIQACELGHNQGCAQAGDILWGAGPDTLCKGQIARDETQSARYWQAGCDQKDGRSCHNLSYMLQLEPNQPERVAESKRLLKQACMLDYKPSCNQLGQ